MVLAVLSIRRYPVAIAATLMGLAWKGEKEAMTVLSARVLASCPDVFLCCSYE